MNLLKSLLKKYRDIIIYLFFGVLTTAVSWLIYFPMYNMAGGSATVSNAISWAGAVTFAFVTNKPFVFQSHDWSAKTVLPELMKFVGCRVGSGVAETVILLLTVDFFHWNGNIMKIATSVLVVVLNYVGSKLVVFKKWKADS